MFIVVIEPNVPVSNPSRNVPGSVPPVTFRSRSMIHCCGARVASNSLEFNRIVKGTEKSTSVALQVSPGVRQALLSVQVSPPTKQTPSRCRSATLNSKAVALTPVSPAARSPNTSAGLMMQSSFGSLEANRAVMLVRSIPVPLDSSSAIWTVSLESAKPSLSPLSVSDGVLQDDLAAGEEDRSSVLHTTPARRVRAALAGLAGSVVHVHVQHVDERVVATLRLHEEHAGLRRRPRRPAVRP